MISLIACQGKNAHANLNRLVPALPNMTQY